MTPTPKVSVIIPTYNRGAFITNAINSVLAQSFKDYEVLVIDDGSTDNTPEVLQPYLDKIKYIHQENSGVSAARNAGIRQAQGEWIAFLDSDDEWFPDYLEWQMERAAGNPQVCTQVANALEISLNGESNLRFKLPYKFQNESCPVLDRPLCFVLDYNICLLQVMVMKRDALLKAGLFNTALTISEDMDMAARMSLQGPLGVCDRVLAYIYRRDEPITNLKRQMTDKGFYFHESLFKVYENLRRQKKLNFKEKRGLTDWMSTNRRSLANLLLNHGKTADARRYYKEAFLIRPSIKSSVKYMLSFLPSNLALRFTKKRGDIDGRHMELEENAL